MSDFLGSYFLGTGDERPAELIHANSMEAFPDRVDDAKNDMRIEPFMERESEEFCPVTVASMSALDKAPTSLVNIHLTRKGKDQFQLPPSSISTGHPRSDTQTTPKEEDNADNGQKLPFGLKSLFGSGKKSPSNQFMRSAMKSFRGIRVRFSPKAGSEEQKENAES